MEFYTEDIIGEGSAIVETTDLKTKIEICEMEQKNLKQRIRDPDVSELLAQVTSRIAEYKDKYR